MHFKTEREVAWRKLEDSIVVRRWDATRTAWIDFGIPTIDPPGSAPEITLSSFLEDIGPFSDVAPENVLDTVITIARAEIPALIFREAVYWLHKSIHVLGASETHVNIGMPTWSLSAAYQSALFAVRSTMAFLGISIGEVQGVSVVADLCRNLQGLTPRKVTELGAFEEQVSLRTHGILFRHAHIWRLFQRLLRVVTRAPWPAGWATFFQHLEIADLVKQRHNLHYDLAFWVMQDLHESVQSASFRDITASGEARELYDTERPNFSLAVAYTLSRMALSLFQSFAIVTNRLALEQQLINAICTAERHPLFADVMAAH